MAGKNSSFFEPKKSSSKTEGKKKKKTTAEFLDQFQYQEKNALQEVQKLFNTTLLSESYSQLPLEKDALQSNS